MVIRIAETTTPCREVYYLPGRGGRIETGLGQGLLARGVRVSGRETFGAFAKLGFQDQVQAIRGDLQDRFWTPDGLVIANSYGAYLFLHALLDLDPFPGRVLLLSPVIGAAIHPQTAARFYPPRADALQKAAKNGKYPKAKNIDVHVGANDWQSGPRALTDFCQSVGMQIQIVPDRGHMLGSDYVGPLLDVWCYKPSSHELVGGT